MVHPHNTGLEVHATRRDLTTGYLEVHLLPSGELNEVGDVAGYIQQIILMLIRSKISVSFFSESQFSSICSNCICKLLEQVHSCSEGSPDTPGANWASPTCRQISTSTRCFCASRVRFVRRLFDLAVKWDGKTAALPSLLPTFRVVADSKQCRQHTKYF